MLRCCDRGNQKMVKKVLILIGIIFVSVASGQVIKGLFDVLTTEEKTSYIKLSPEVINLVHGKTKRIKITIKNQTQTLHNLTLVPEGVEEDEDCIHIRTLSPDEKKDIFIYITVPQNAKKEYLYTIKVTADEIRQQSNILKKYGIESKQYQTVAIKVKIIHLRQITIFTILGIIFIFILLKLIHCVKKGFKNGGHKGVLNLTIALSGLTIICSIILAEVYDNSELLGISFIVPAFWILYLVYLQVRYVVTGEKSLKPTVILSIIGVVITVSVLIEDSNKGVGLLVPLIPWGAYLILNFFAKLYKPIRIVITANVCPKCQTSNRSVSKYCKDCGHSLSLQVARKQIFFWGVVVVALFFAGYFVISQINKSSRLRYGSRPRPKPRPRPRPKQR